VVEGAAELDLPGGTAAGTWRAFRRDAGADRTVTLGLDRPSDEPETDVRLDDLGDVLLLPEIAAVLRTSTRTIKRHLRAGTFPIPSLPGIDKRLRFAKADVARYLHRDRRGRKC